ncbi:MAG: hypothetical protein KC422_16435 [Trueperaceae bacterium]|nr:hypothetical protein [Trueperaceae bacterium]
MTINKASFSFKFAIFSRLIVSLICLMGLAQVFAHAPGMSAINFYYNEDAFIVRVYGHLSTFGEDYQAGVEERFQLELDGQKVGLEPTQIFVNTMLDWVTWEAELGPNQAPQSIKVDQELFPELSMTYTIVSVLKNDELQEQFTLNEPEDFFSYSYQPKAKGFMGWFGQLFHGKN